MEVEKINSNWKLKSIEIEFKKGWCLKDTPEHERHDRYEGLIKFENNDRESFSFRVKPDMAKKYIDLIANDIVTAANGLSEGLKKSLGLS